MDSAVVRWRKASAGREYRCFVPPEQDKRLPLTQEWYHPLSWTETCWLAVLAWLPCYRTRWTSDALVLPWSHQNSRPSKRIHNLCGDGDDDSLLLYRKTVFSAATIKLRRNRTTTTVLGYPEPDTAGEGPALPRSRLWISADTQNRQAGAFTPGESNVLAHRTEVIADEPWQPNKHHGAAASPADTGSQGPWWHTKHLTVLLVLQDAKRLGFSLKIIYSSISMV